LAASRQHNDGTYAVKTDGTKDIMEKTMAITDIDLISGYEGSNATGVVSTMTSAYAYQNLHRQNKIPITATQSVHKKRKIKCAGGDAKTWTLYSISRSIGHILLL